MPVAFHAGLFDQQKIDRRYHHYGDDEYRRLHYKIYVIIRRRKSIDRYPSDARDDRIVKQIDRITHTADQSEGVDRENAVPPPISKDDQVKREDRERRNDLQDKICRLRMFITDHEQKQYQTDDEHNRVVELVELR